MPIRTQRRLLFNQLDESELVTGVRELNMICFAYGSTAGKVPFPEVPVIQKWTVQDQVM